jgi:hypothetical protein
MRKHLRYLSYVLRHKFFVFVAGWRLGAPFWRLFVHDLPKLLPCEWMPYVRHFYGGEYPDWNRVKYVPGWPYEVTKQGVAEAFDRAWLHHQHANPHHWQHWVLREDSGQTKVLEMPEAYILEMLADWYGAGRAITGKWGARDWYLKNRGRMMLHPQTANRLNELLRIDEDLDGR